MLGYGSPPDLPNKLHDFACVQHNNTYLPTKSLKDTLLGEYANSLSMEFEDWIEMNKVRVNFLDNDWTIPKVTFSKETLHLLSRPWERFLVVKFLGKSIGHQVFCRRIHALWKLREELDVLDLGHDFFFLLRFHIQEDLTDVLFNSPWLIQNHYLMEEMAPRLYSLISIG